MRSLLRWLRRLLEVLLEPLYRLPAEDRRNGGPTTWRQQVDDRGPYTFPSLDAARVELVKCDEMDATLASARAWIEAQIKADPSILMPFPGEVQARVQRANATLLCLDGDDPNKCSCCGSPTLPEWTAARKEAIRSTMGAVIAQEEAKRDLARKRSELEGMTEQWKFHRIAVTRWIETSETTP